MSESLLTDVATLLQVETIAPEDALPALVDYQRTNHPDRFQDPEAQRAATVRFTKASNLIEQVRTSVDRSAAGLVPVSANAIERVPTPQLALVRAQLEIASLLQQSATSNEELRSARLEIEHLTFEVQRLKEALAAKVNAGLAKV